MITLKGIIDEDFVNYKKPAMVIMYPHCNFKCDKEFGKPICQNSALAQAPNIEIGPRALLERYLKNPITEAIVFQGLEPLDDLWEINFLINGLRFNYNCNDDVVIYTGYNKDEINKEFLYRMKCFGNVIIKYGRYIPNQTPHYDEVLGVNLASDNQYAERL